MIRSIIFTCTVFVLVIETAHAATPPLPVAPVLPIPPIQRTLTPPTTPTPATPRGPSADGLEDQVQSQTFELNEVLIHARDLGITDDQRAKMTKETQSLALRLNSDLWPPLITARATLSAKLAARPVDERQVRDALDAVLKYEREVKQARMAMLVHIKNLLTSDQISRLQRFRATGIQKQ